MKRGSGWGDGLPLLEREAIHLNDVDASVFNFCGCLICQNVGIGTGMNAIYSDFLLSKQNIFLYALP